MSEVTSTSVDKPGTQARSDVRATARSLIISAWLLGVLVTFLVVRVLGSSTGQRFVAMMRNHFR